MCAPSAPEDDEVVLRDTDHGAGAALRRADDGNVSMMSSLTGSTLTAMAAVRGPTTQRQSTMDSAILG